MEAVSSKRLKSPSIITKTTTAQPFPTKFTRTHFLKLPQRPQNNAFLRASVNPFNSSFLSISSSSSSSSFNSFLGSNANETALGGWDKVPELVVDNGGNAEAFGSKNRVITVVLLGWLGAEEEHLKRYVEWYNSRGIHAVTFFVEVEEMLSFDVGSRLEQRISELGNELTRWVLEKEEDGRERSIIFHTFSNTGWLVYGSFLHSFQTREGLMEKIGGVIIDSGAGDPLKPEVWAAGFASAMLKKCGSSVDGLQELQKEEADAIEAAMVDFTEMLFEFFGNMPDRRLRTVINSIVEHPPPCPQLYLYSTADKVVPYDSIESSIEEMRKKGIEVFSFNFALARVLDVDAMISTVVTLQDEDYETKVFNGAGAETRQVVNVKMFGCFWLDFAWVIGFLSVGLNPVAGMFGVVVITIFMPLDLARARQKSKELLISKLIRLLPTN